MYLYTHGKWKRFVFNIYVINKRILLVSFWTSVKQQRPERRRYACACGIWSTENTTATLQKRDYVNVRLTMSA